MVPVVRGGNIGEITVMVVLAVDVPPLPLQLRLYVDVAFSAPVVVEPLSTLLPLQALLAVQEVAFVELQVMVAEAPAVRLVGEAFNATVGAGVTVTALP